MCTFLIMQQPNSSSSDYHCDAETNPIDQFKNVHTDTN